MVLYCFRPVPIRRTACMDDIFWVQIDRLDFRDTPEISSVHIQIPLFGSLSRSW
jgi:hypothetical protein